MIEGIIILKKGLEMSNENKGTPAKNDIKEGGLLKRWFKGKMTDDKGIFQGGTEKRSFGRIKDRRDSRAADDSIQPDSLNKKAGYDLKQYNKVYNPGFKDKPYSDEFNNAREFALDFNPSDTDQVMEMQKRHNQAGYLGANGQPLKVDGMLGEQTVAGLRSMQSDMIYENKMAKSLVMKSRKLEHDKNAMSQVNDWIKQDSEKTNLKASVQKQYGNRGPAYNPWDDKTQPQPDKDGVVNVDEYKAWLKKTDPKRYKIMERYNTLPDTINVNLESGEYYIGSPSGTQKHTKLDK